MIEGDVRMGLYLLVEQLNPLVVKYKKEILSHFRTNNLVTTIINIASDGIINPSLDDLTLQLRVKDVNPTIADQVLGAYEQLDRTETTIEGIRHYYKNIITSKMLDKASQISDVDAYLKEVARINNLDFNEKTKVESAVKSKKFSDLDPTQIEDGMKNSIPSFWEPLNKSNPYGGYRSEQLITVSGAPGSGKSLFLMQELLKSLELGRHCIYCAIGDLIEEDFIVRLAAAKFRVPMSDIFFDFRYYKKKLLEELPSIDRMSILFIKPGKLTANDLVDYLDANELSPEPTTIFIDYDSNLVGGDSLYSKGDEIYSAAADLASRPDHLVFIASQPKIQYFQEELIGMNGIGESSRKIHIPDTIITIGKRPNCVNPVGYINICKQRRGVLVAYPYFRDVSGEFIPVTEQQKSELGSHATRYTINCCTSSAGKYET